MRSKPWMWMPSVITFFVHGVQSRRRESRLLLARYVINQLEVKDLLYRHNKEEQSQYQVLMSCITECP